MSLKHSLGEGYTIGVSLPEIHGEKQSQAHAYAQRILAAIIPITPHARCTQLSETTATFALRSKDPRVVREVLEALEYEKTGGTITSYDVHGTSLEDIFIGLMGRDTQFADGRIIEDPTGDMHENKSSQEIDSAPTPTIPEDPAPLDLTNGRQTWFFQQSWTIFRKRLLIFRRSWLGPLIAMAIACCGAAVPLFFMKNR